MQNQVQNILNNFFNNISYDLASYTDVVSTNNLENFFTKGMLLVVGISMAQILIFYTLNNFSKLDRDIKQVKLKCRGKKISDFRKVEYTKQDHLVHSIYYIFYATIYIISGYLLVKGVF